MTDHTATVPAYIRTEAGTIKVGVGERVPDDALPTEITRLAAAGVIAATEPQESADDSAGGHADAPAAPRSRARSRDQSGHSKDKES